MVIYDPHSGDTHCLDRMASAILDHLFKHSSSSFAELDNHISQASGQTPERRSTDALAAALGELEKLRLIRRVA